MSGGIYDVLVWVFWLSAGLIGYTYLGYPLVLWMRSLYARKPLAKAPLLPAVSILLAVRDEAASLTGKLQNLAALDYPADRLQVIVVGDGATDEIKAVLASASSALTVIQAEALGKAAALGRGLGAATGEIVVFTDVRQEFEPDAIRQLVAPFADATVGCVSGELMLREPQDTQGRTIGLYWEIEKWMRHAESLCGSTIGATGAIYAVRRELVVPPPPGTILDDVFIPLHVVRAGYRSVFEPDAIAWDQTFDDPAREFRRKVRTLTGNYQLLQLAPWLISPRNPVLLAFVSHKLLRLVVPFALLAILLSSCLLPAWFYRAVFILQLAFYLLGLAALVRIPTGPIARFANSAMVFLMLNAAAVVAFVNFVLRRKVAWTR